ncbi:hypothetical protein DERP_005288 [Dermatophagoides pteronyssinus]|uniref:Uncharacterized protein n=1 Tax=Dermatophagoides pteronyssinus TaxID=6956 RepID=A0ABQ8JMK5_DERPT|nr:hypothetical protein DERP_005288 [Dermatophagoides pteronyssinus]
MGSNVCKTLHLPLTSQQQRRHDLKDSRFDQNDNNHNNRNGGGKRSLNFGIHNSKKQGKIKQRVQVQPITERLVEVNTSYLDHIQSNIRMDDKNNFIEQLNCSYCEKKIFTDNKNDVLDHNSHHSHKNNHPRTPSPDTTLNVRPEVMNIPSIEDDDDDDKKLIATTPLSDRSADNPEKKSLSDSIKVSPSGSQSSSSSSCSSSSSSSPQRNVDPFPIINEHENDDDNNADKPGSISPILYRSVSTIPMCLEEEEEEENEAEDDHDEHGDSINELPKKMNKSSSTKNNQFMAITNEKFPRKKCRSLPRLDSKFNLLIQNWSDLDLLTKEFVKTGDKMNNNNEKNGEEFCEFCEYIKGGGADKTSTWTNLDKDVTMLIDMADRLGMMIMEKEKDKEISGVGEDIVEEKKVSLSYLEKLNNSMDLKQKVHFLRKKRQVGISVMKTSGGKCLMDFNDGQNSYQIQSRCLIIYFISFFEIF